MVCYIESARVNFRAIREPDTSENDHADERTHDAEEEQTMLYGRDKLDADGLTDGDMVIPSLL